MQKLIYFLTAEIYFKKILPLLEFISLFSTEKTASGISIILWLSLARVLYGILQNCVCLRGLEGSSFFLHGTGLESTRKDRAQPFCSVRWFSERRIEGDRKERRKNGNNGWDSASVTVQGEHTVIGYIPFLLLRCFRENWAAIAALIASMYWCYRANMRSRQSYYKLIVNEEQRSSR